MDVSPEILEMARHIGDVSATVAIAIPVGLIFLVSFWKPKAAKFKALKCSLFPGAAMSYCLAGPLVRWFYGFSYGITLGAAFKAWLLFIVFFVVIIWPVAYWLIKRKEK